MEWSRIAFIAVYLLALCAYFFAETSGKMRYRAPNKILVASLFLAYAVAAFFPRYEVRSYQVLLLVAVFLAWCGDIFLLWSFRKGGVFFFCANICFFVYGLVFLRDQGLSFRDLWWFLAAFALSFGGLALAVRGRKAQLGKVRIAVLAYGASVALQGTLGLALAVNARRAAGPAVKLVLFGLGLFLFLVSDCFMALHKAVFRDSKAVLRINSGAYFVGLLLVVLSMSY